MSVASSYYSCERCNAHWSRDILNGRFEYEMGDASRLNIERTVAWCDACDNIVPAENFDVLALQQRITGHLKTAAEKRSSAEMLNSQRTFLQRLLGRVPAEVGLLQSDSKWATSLATNYSKFLEFVASQNRKPRCLLCGSVNITYLPEVLSKDTGEEVPVAFKHPGCGGKLWLRPSDLRMYRTIAKRVYSAEGILIGTDGTSSV